MIPPTAGAGTLHLILVMLKDMIAPAPDNRTAESQTPDDGPGFTLPDIDDDIRADFAALGLVIGEDNVVAERDLGHMEQAKREAVAATFLRLIGECDEEIARADATRSAQIALINAHYDRIVASQTRRRAEFVRHVEYLAVVSAESGGFGKKKSARTPFGDFGVTDRKAGLQLVDEAALLAHLVANDPTRVRVIAKVRLDEARRFLSPRELEASKLEPLWKDLKASLSPGGVLPPGVEAVPAARVPFATPAQPSTLIVETRSAA